MSEIRRDLVQHLREQIERDPEAFLRGRLPCTTAIILNRISEEAE